MAWWWRKDNVWERHRIEQTPSAQQAWDEIVVKCCPQKRYWYLEMFQTLNNNFMLVRKSFTDGFLRYDNPDMFFLGNPELLIWKLDRIT